MRALESDYFERLPTEMVHKIVDYLDEDDRIHLFMASSNVRHLCLNKTSLDRYSKNYEFHGRPGPGHAVTRIEVAVNFQLSYADLYANVFEDLRSTALSSLSFNETANIYVAVMPSIRCSFSFAKFLEGKIRSLGLDWLQVHYSGGFMTDPTRARLKKEKAVVIITHRTEGYLMMHSKAFFIAPVSSEVVYRTLINGSLAASIYWPLTESRAYNEVTAFCKSYDQKHVPNEPWKWRPEVEFNLGG